MLNWKGHVVACFVILPYFKILSLLFFFLERLTNPSHDVRKFDFPYSKILIDC